ncbi:uncharacterized protein LOC62_05G007699 [Vanrija pseudolonga]|uniref:Uncharacterized protein n=1 Tax=Vanrija pseudolonga TaxID=143232 RepID=A0AAF1BT08_9TREE|nr:hypothetical protein LOC62_05G007699 [Vanrija pseudolonga]
MAVQQPQAPDGYRKYRELQRSAGCFEFYKYDTVEKIVSAWHSRIIYGFQLQEELELHRVILANIIDKDKVPLLRDRLRGDEPAWLYISGIVELAPEERPPGLKDLYSQLKKHAEALRPSPPPYAPEKALPRVPDTSDMAVRELYREDDAKRNYSIGKGKEKDPALNESHKAVSKLYREDDATRNHYDDEKGKGKGKDKELEAYAYDDGASIFSGPAPSYKTHPDIHASSDDRPNDAEDRIRELERQLAQSRGLGRGRLGGVLFGRAFGKGQR